jgi:hypothetical protein
MKFRVPLKARTLLASRLIISFSRTALLRIISPVNERQETAVTVPVCTWIDPPIRQIRDAFQRYVYVLGLTPWLCCSYYYYYYYYYYHYYNSPPLFWSAAKYHTSPNVDERCNTAIYTITLCSINEMLLLIKYVEKTDSSHLILTE